LYIHPTTTNTANQNMAINVESVSRPHFVTLLLQDNPFTKFGLALR